MPSKATIEGDGRMRMADSAFSNRAPSVLPQKALLWPYFYLSTACLGLLVIISQLDVNFSIFWHDKGSEGWKQFMNRRFFEGSEFGASDFPNLLLISSFMLYGLGAPYLRRNAPHILVKLGFVNLTTIWIACLVHLLKGASHRPRPFQTLEQGFSFQNFYDLSSWTLRGWGQGSFPSGHTASMMGLIVFAYLVSKVHLKRLVAVCTISAALAMAAARIMVGAHWLSDTLGSIFPSLIFIPTVAPVVPLFGEEWKSSIKTWI